MNEDQTTNFSTEEIVIDQPEVQHSTEENSDSEHIAKLETDLSESKDKYLRLYSEFENFRRRTSKEKMELISSASEQLMLALIPVADDIERFYSNQDTITDLQVLKDGVKLIFSKFSRTLEQKGLKTLEAKGENFDSELHEAITQIPAPSDEMKGKVVDEIEKGYYLNDKLIRVAKVVIGA